METKEKQLKIKDILHEDEDIDEDIDKDEIRTKLGLDKYKVLKLKGESRENFDLLTREANSLPNLKKQIIKDEHKYQDANIDLNEINVAIKATEDYNPRIERK